MGELGREQTNLYKLQSYYIYSTQAEPEPWGTQDGNNLRSRFAWSYAAFGRSDTVNGWGGAQARLHLCDRYPHPAAPGGMASAPRRERLMEKRRGDRVFLVLSVPMEFGEEYRDVFVPPRATLVHCLQVHGDFSVLSHSSTHLGRERRRNEGSRY